MSIQGRKVLITRPVLQAQPLVAALSEAGGIPIQLPMLDIRAFTEDQIEKDKILNLDYYDIIIVVSLNAAKTGLGHVDQYWPQLPLHTLWLAVGSATAEVLSNYGIDVKIPTQPNSEGLLSMSVLQNFDEQRILIMKGQGGRELLEQTLKTRGARVDTLDLYQREMPNYSNVELQDCLEQQAPDVVLATSANVLDNLVTIVSPHLPSLKSIPLVVASRRIAGHAQDLGFHQVVIAADASDKAVLTALKQLS